MNFPQCQERLDERLDNLRSGLQSGAVSPSDARKQAQVALEEMVRECADGEAQLRAHTQMRLALMIPVAGELQAVPPELRLNVRRALEQETARRPVRGAWRPITNFAWTGGAMLSALGLFLVARPFLIERAQHPLPTTETVSSGAESTPASAPTSKSAPASTSKTAPGKASTAAPTIKSKAGSPAPPAKMPVPGSSSATKAATKGRQPQVVPAPPVEHSAPTTATSKQKPASRFEVRAPTPRPTSDASGGSSSRSSAPASPIAPEGAPRVGSASPRIMMAKRARPQSASSPSPAPADSALITVSGAELGLVARFVPVSSAPQQRNRVSAGGSADFVPPPMVGAGAPSSPAQVSKPAPPAGSVAAPSPQEAPAKADDSHLNRASKRSQPIEGVVPDNDAPVLRDENSASRAQNTPSSKEGLALLVSVEHTVANARIVGQVAGRKGEGVELWSGNATAHQPIVVPLAPLHPASGDTVQMAIEQRVAGGKTRELAKTSVVVP